MLWIEDSRDELEPATLDAIDRNITDEYTLEDGVWYEGIIESVTKSYAKVRFDEDGVSREPLAHARDHAAATAPARPLD